jgi:hypothetical protein
MEFHGKQPKPKGKPLGAPLRQRLQALVNEQGEVKAAAHLGLARQTLVRALAGLPIQRGTVAQVQAAFPEVQA